MRKRNVKSAGFTLVELMVVVVIIGLLAAAVLMNIDRTDETVYPVIIKNDFNTIGNALTRFKLDTGHYPESLEELLYCEARGWKGPYLGSPPLDPWKRSYLYEFTGGSLKPYTLKTLGADGEEGGEEEGKTENKDYCNLDVFEEYKYSQK